MFILYAVLAGLVAGFLLGGRLDRLAELPIRFGPVAVIALAVQLVLFSPLADRLSSDVARLIYVASTAVVGAVVVANIRLPGIPLVVAGAACNLAAILANGGAMPASVSALAALGAEVRPHTNSVPLDHPNLEPLTDVFAMPSWLPLANIFSIGDILIATGVAIAVATAMRGPARPTPNS